MTGFQTSVNVTQAPAVAGDFASMNPRHSALTVPGGMVAGVGGLTMGLFAWLDSATGTILLNTGTGVPSGFCHREIDEGLITTYLAETSMVIPAGSGYGGLFNGGDFWVKNTGAGAVTVGMKAFAVSATGLVNFAAAGATVVGSVETKWYAHTAGATLELIKMSDTIPD